MSLFHFFFHWKVAFQMPASLRKCKNANLLDSPSMSWNKAVIVAHVLPCFIFLSTNKTLTLISVSLGSLKFKCGCKMKNMLQKSPPHLNQPVLQSKTRPTQYVCLQKCTSWMVQWMESKNWHNTDVGLWIFGANTKLNKIVEPINKVQHVQVCFHVFSRDRLQEEQDVQD